MVAKDEHKDEHKDRDRDRDAHKDVREDGYFGESVAAGYDDPSSEIFTFRVPGETL